MARGVGAGVLAAALVLAGPAPAQPIAPDADKVLWCASAFFWLAGNADDAGDVAEAELYDGWATELTDRGTILLSDAGFDLARVQEIIGEYDSTVLDELASEQPRYDVAVCPELVAD